MFITELRSGNTAAFLVYGLRIFSFTMQLPQSRVISVRRSTSGPVLENELPGLPARVFLSLNPQGPPSLG